MTQPSKLAQMDAAIMRYQSDVDDLRAALAACQRKSEERKAAIQIMLDFLYGDYDDVDGTASSETRMNAAARKALED
jgi:hypothetical protein